MDTSENGIIDRKSLREEIFEVLHKRIISGKYTPGEWLRQEEISSQMGVSQTPVREALDLLVSSGLAERVPYRGVRVLQLTPDEIIDAYGLRMLLESTAAAVTAHNCTEEQLHSLYVILEKTEALMTLNDMPVQMQLNREFHKAIVEASGNSLLTKVFEIVSHQFPDWMLYEYMFRHPELLQPSLKNEYLEHKAIIDAIADKNPEAAAKNVIIHIKNLGEELVSFLNIRRDLLAQKEIEIMANWKSPRQN